MQTRDFQISEPEVRGIVERLVLIEVLSFDWNCSKYITPRHSAAEVEAQLQSAKR